MAYQERRARVWNQRRRQDVSTVAAWGQVNQEFLLGFRGRCGSFLEIREVFVVVKVEVVLILLCILTRELGGHTACDLPTCDVRQRRHDLGSSLSNDQGCKCISFCQV